MPPLKKLAGQTAIYGLSSIIGRFLNYLLVPLHTAVFTPDRFGIITEMYAYVAFLVVLLNYGMETAFFRFSNKEGQDAKKVFTTAVYALAVTTFAFIAVSTAFSVPIAEWLKYPNNSEYVIWFAFIVGLDALSAIPLAKLRAENKALRFALINLGNVLVNISLNLFFLMYCLPQYEQGNTNFFIDTFYNPEIGVGYVFIANLVASIFKFLLLTPELLQARFGFDPKLLQSMLRYSSPLLLAGLAGIINETLDRILLKRILFDIKGETQTMFMIGVYGACYKIAIVMNLFLQAFRYAAEPFFFAEERKKDAKETYAEVMNWFVIVVSTIFLGVLLFLDIFKYFVPNEAYWEGLKVVPILLMAYIFLGIYYNQSVWYKLTEKTRFGAYLMVIGAVITIVINYIWIPEYGYMASAWATFACYGTIMLLSYILGQRFYPIPYNLKKIAGYIIFAFLLYRLSIYLEPAAEAYKYGLNTLIFLVWAAAVFLLERPKKSVI